MGAVKNYDKYVKNYLKKTGRLKTLKEFKKSLERKKQKGPWLIYLPYKLLLFLDERKPVKLSFTIQKAPERKIEVATTTPKKTKKTPKKVEEEKKAVIIPDKFTKLAKRFGLPDEHLEFFYENRESFHWEAKDENFIHCCEPTCNFTTKPSKDCLVEHMKVVHHYADIPCDKPDCGFIAFSKKNLVMHVRSFHGLGRRPSDRCHLPCPYPNCKSYFADEWNLQIHTSVHENRNYSCNYCQYRCQRNAGLADHLKIHFNIKNFVCDVCSRSFSRKTSYTTHLKNHSNTVYECICKFTSYKRYDLDVHRKVCEERLKELKALKAH